MDRGNKKDDPYIFGTTSEVFTLEDISKASEMKTSTVPGDNTIGIADVTGVLTKKYIKESVDWTRILEELAKSQYNEILLIDGTKIQLSENVNDPNYYGAYEIIPYVIKYDWGGVSGRETNKGWHIDCAVVPKDRYQLNYVVNGPEVYDVGGIENSALIGPGATYLMKPGQVSVASPAISKNKQELKVDVEYDAKHKSGEEIKNVKVVFLGWKALLDNNTLGDTLYKPNDQFNLDKLQATLVGQWKVIADDWHDGDNPEDDKETGGDDTPDYKQALIRYQVSVLNENHEEVSTVPEGIKVSTPITTDGKHLQVETLEEVDDSYEGEIDLQGEVSSGKDTGYAFAYWMDSENNVASYNKALTGEKLTVEGGKEYIYTAVFLPDTKGGPDDPENKGDEVPDEWQVTIIYQAGSNGSLVGGTVRQIVSLYVNDKPTAGPVSIVPSNYVSVPGTSAAPGYYFFSWTGDPTVTLSVKGGETHIFTANFALDQGSTPYFPPVIPSNPGNPVPTPGGTTITDDETPLAGSVGLNDTDHFAYVIGYDDDTVRPLNNITRAEAATIFFRLMTDEYRQANWSTTNSFTDVNAGDWYNNAISTCANAGVLKGYDDGTFRPNAPITRAEFASMAAGFMDESITDDGTGDFSDTANHWAAVAIRRAAKAGWVTGTGNKFNPDAKITRAEVMTIVNRMLDRTPDKDHMLPTMKTWIDNPESEWYYEAVQEATNEHDYERDDLNVETWTELLTVRDWKALETEWADNGGASAPKADPEPVEADGEIE